ncbi:MAG: NUDIX hydrolase [Pseudomonadota bacterium]
MTRRYGDRIDPKRTYIKRPGVYAILVRKGHVLLTHQAEPEPEFQLPGGGIDPGEQPIAALHREVFEETGWRIAPVRRLTVYRRFGYMPEYDLWAEKLCHIYLAHPVRCYGPPSEPGHTPIWMTPEVAEDALASAGDRDVLAAWRAASRRT